MDRANIFIRWGTDIASEVSVHLLLSMRLDFFWHQIHNFHKNRELDGEEKFQPLKSCQCHLISKSNYIVKLSLADVIDPDFDVSAKMKNIDAWEVLLDTGLTTDFAKVFI